MKSRIRQTRAARWLAHVAQWRQSGMSKAAYCIAHGLNFSSFRYWLRKSRSALVDVPALPPAIVPLSFTLAPKAPPIGLLVGNRYALDCQTASNNDPPSASNFDPLRACL